MLLSDIADFLNGQSVYGQVVGDVKAAVERLGRLTLAENPKGARLECFATLEAAGVVRLVLRDDGRLADRTRQLGGDCRYLTALGCNRTECRFEI